MNKKLFALALSLGLTAGAAGAITANAAIKETTVGDNIITEAGIVNELDWSLKGSQDAYKTTVLGDRFKAKDVGWGAGYLVPFDKTSFADGDVTLAFDLYYYKGGNMCPYIVDPTVGTGIYTSTLNQIWFGGPDNGMANGSEDPHKATIGYYADEGLTTRFSGYLENQTGTGLCWQSLFGGTPGEMSYHVEYIFKANGVMGAKTYALNADGTYDAKTPYGEIWIKVGYKTEASKEYRFGLRYFGDLTIDNFKLSTPAKTVFETDFKGTDWSNSTESPKAGTIFNNNGKGIKISNVEVSATKSERIVTELEVKKDLSSPKAFTLTGALDFEKLGEFGIAMGLETQEQAFDAEGVSYVYFTQSEGVAYLNLMENGKVVGEATEIGTLVAGDFYDFTLLVNSDGTATFAISDKTVDLTITPANIDGYLALGTNAEVDEGESAAVVAINCDLQLIRYSFRGSVGEAFGSNFNTNWINPERWEMLNGNPVMFNDNAEARGILVEDGEMKFAGVGHGSYFGTTEEYADYVVEFLYKEGSDVDKPKLVDGYEYGYSYLTVITGAGMTTTPSGWAESTMITFVNGQIEIRDFKQTPNLIEFVKIDYDFRPTEAGAYKTTAIKIVAVNNKITVYYQEVVDGTDPTAAAYIKGCEFTTVDTYGKINFVATEAGVFSVDNIRITPVDDPDATTMAANLANYVDFAPIADENRPYDLNAPVITLTENVIGWTAVEGATGYIVNVNGTKTEVGADVLSYTITATEAGDYTITVVAKGNGDWIGDSAQSNAVEFTIAAPKKDTKKKKGCGSVLAGGSVLTMLAAAGVALVATKKKED